MSPPGPPLRDAVSPAPRQGGGAGPPRGAGTAPPGEHGAGPPGEQGTGPAPHGSRRQARERALSLLYEAEAKGVPVGRVLGELPVPPSAFALDLVRGVQSHLEELDGLIATHAIDWSLDRMPVVDRTLLRMATYELLYRPDVPVAAAISEAVELAKQYSTEESGRFVNGVLAAIAACLPARPT